MATEPQYMSLNEFRESGLLQELNRQFLHPLGLAMAVAVDDEGNVTHIVGIQDHRDDPEGTIYAQLGYDAQRKAERFEVFSSRRHAARNAALGYVIQPLELAFDGDK